MPAFSSYLGLTLPGFEEYVDSWNTPNNGNFVLIDSSLQAVATEIVAARQSKASLLGFLQVAHNADGTLLAAPEVIRARVSPVFGFKSGTGQALPLKARLDSLDYELYLARYGQASLIDSFAFARSGITSLIVTGAVDGTGAPAWLGSTSATVRVDGTSPAINLLIAGYPGRVRTSRSILMTGATGTHYLVATRAPAGLVTVDGTVAAAGQTSVDSSGDMTLFTDTGVNFAASDVQPGDILTLTTGNDAGRYIIAAVAPGGPLNQLKIIGTFPVGGLSSIAYTVSDPFGVTLTQQPTATLAANQMIIGEADFDGTAVTAVRPRNFGDSYNSPWRFFDLTTTSTHEEVFNHFLGDNILDIEVHVSQANDGTQPVEFLSTADLSQVTAVTVTDGKTILDTKTVAVANTLTFNPGTSNATLTGGAQTLANAVTATLGGSVALGGTITATAGAVAMTRSVAVKWDRNQIFVRNVTPSLLYKDYSNAQHQTGYVRVVVRKRG